MEGPQRMSPEEVRKKVMEGKALLVCAYEDEEKFKKVRLERAISLGEFKLRLPSLTKNQEVIFYCAWNKEASAAREAAKLIALGFEKVECLAGGVEAWKQAGYPTY